MANTYTQIHLQAVFAVKNRQSLIEVEWKDGLYKYITGIIQKNGHKLLSINGMPDHVHILFGMRPNQSISELMKFVKGDSSKWVNQNGLSKQRFSWQSGYGCFSYAKSELPVVIRYIENQEEHHRRKSFLKEYLDFLREFEVDYDEQYVFNSVCY